MQFSQAYSTALQTNMRNAFQFAPATFAARFPQSGEIANLASDKHRLDIGNLTKDLKALGIAFNQLDR